MHEFRPKDHSGGFAAQQPEREAGERSAGVKDWRKEKITIDAAYGNEHMSLYLFVPTRVNPPYQIVVFYPSARVLDLQNNNTLGDMQFVDFYHSKRARGFVSGLQGPIRAGRPEHMAGRETLIQDSKDMDARLMTSRHVPISTPRESPSWESVWVPHWAWTGRRSKNGSKP